MWKRLALAFGLALLGGAVQSEPVALTPEQMRLFGQEALIRGYADQALSIAAALLRRDPGDVAALVLKAQALRIKGDLPASEAVARRAWGLAVTPGNRYAAALALAQALSLQDRRIRAQFWLRQAIQTAPNAAARRQALDDFAYVRDQNPLSLQFDATIRPSNNVNGGARSPLFEFMGIPFILSGDALALSGLTYGLGVSGSYRLSDDGTASSALTFGLSHQSVVLSAEAQVQAPDARNADYALSQAEIGWQWERDSGNGPVTLEVSLGQSWYGGADLAQSLGAGVSLTRRMAGDTSLTLSADVTRQDRLDRPVASSLDGEIGVRLATAGPGGDRWQVGLDLGITRSEDITVDHREAGLSLGWQAARPVAGVGLGASLSARLSDFDASPYAADGRHDRRLSASLTAELRKLTYLGYSPVLSLDYARARSNISLYDTEAFGLSLRLQSRF